MTKAIIFTDMAGYYGWGRAGGAYRIASEFRKRGDEVKVIDCFSSYTIEQIKQIILDRKTSQTEWIGFSTTFMTGDASTQRLEDSEWQSQNQKAQYFVTRNSDGTPTGLSLKEEWLLFDWIKQQGLQVILGGYRISTTKIHKDALVLTGPAEEYFFNDFEFTQSRIDYTNEDFINPNEDLPIEVARGCIFKCKFCYFPMLGKRLWEFVKTPETLKKEMLFNYDKYGTTGYMVSDETYNDSPEKVKVLCDMYKSLPFNMTFSTFARLDLLIAHPHTQELLYESGLRSVFFGIETFNKTAGKFIGKGMDPDKVKKGLLEFRKKYPDVLVYTSMIGGLPTETLDEMEESFRFLKDEAKVHNISYHKLTFITGTDLDTNAAQYGYNLNSRNKTWTREDGLTSDEMGKWCVEKRKTQQYHPAGFTFYNRVRNLGYTDKELMPLTFASDVAEIKRRTREKRQKYMSNVL